MCWTNLRIFERSRFSRQCPNMVAIWIEMGLFSCWLQDQTMAASSLTRQASSQSSRPERSASLPQRTSTRKSFPWPCRRINGWSVETFIANDCNENTKCESCIARHEFQWELLETRAERHVQAKSCAHSFLWFLGYRRQFQLTICLAKSW